MREAKFVKLNSPKWDIYENEISNDPDELAKRYISLTDDLAFAKTFYKNSKTTAYLNGLASKHHQSIYINKKEKTNRFIIFWKTELPGLFFYHKKSLVIAFTFFIISCLIGALSAKYDDTFIRLILGDGYVNMTNENIAKGDPFGVYKSQEEFMMFITIALNNIFVAFYTFVGGIFLSLGTVTSMVRNGIMLGSFEYYFFSKGLGIQSILVIWIHGTLEISAIIIAGAAGIILGNSILFPKTYTRLEAFKRGAKDGLKIIVGLVPIFIIAAFFEGFITRHTNMPLWCSLFILLTSLSFIIWYVIIYPQILANKLKYGTKN